MVGLAITEASYNGNPLKNAANKKINLKKCFLAKSTLPSNPATELCKPYFTLAETSESGSLSITDLLQTYFRISRYPIFNL